MTYYTAKQEFIDFVNKIIAEKPQFAEIREYAPNIGYLFMVGTKPKPRMKVATCTRCGKLLKFLAHYDYVLMIDDAIWNEINDETTKEMIIVHELTHIRAVRDKEKKIKFDSAGDPVWAVIDHDVQDFKYVLETYPNAYNIIGQAIAKLVKNDEGKEKKNDE